MTIYKFNIISLRVKWKSLFNSIQHIDGCCSCVSHVWYYDDDGYVGFVVVLLV